MGEELVILCRDRAGKVHVFLNSCRHRGMKVCRYDEGNTPVFTCPYHGWSYGTDGRLVGVPYFREAYHSTLDRAQWGLVEVAQLCLYKGTVWASWDPSAPPFLEYLGDFCAISTCSSMAGTAARAARGAGRHPEMAHSVQLEIPGREFLRRQLSQYQPPLGRPGRHRPSRQRPPRHAGAADGARGCTSAFPSAATRPGSTCCRRTTADAARLPALAGGRRIFPRIAKASGAGGAASGRRLIGSPGEIFPNTALHPRQPRTIAVWHPRGAARDRGAGAGIWSIAAAPTEVKAFLRDYYIRYSGPAGMTEQDDMENWNYAHAASRGMIARRYPYNYEQGTAARPRITNVRGCACPGTVIDITEAKSSEHNLRNLYRRWARVHGGRKLGRTGHLADCAGGRMTEPINIRVLKPGTRIALIDGATAEIVSNPSDGVWVFARYLSSPDDPARIGSEEMIFAQDIVEIRTGG